MRWGLFLTDQRLQLAFRRVCYELARLLDSPAAVYAPDSAWAASLAYDLPYEGYTLQEIIARLGERHGPPAPSIGAIYTVLDDGGTWRGDGYFVDTFADLAREAGV